MAKGMTGAAMDKVFLRWVGTLLMSVLVQLEAGAEPSWHVVAGQTSKITLNDESIRLSRALKAKLKGATDAAFLPFESPAAPGRHLRWLVVRASSRSTGEAGFCGAGHEDQLMLIAVKGRNAKALSGFPVQSCMTSVSMEADRFEDLVAKLKQNPQTGALDFEQSVSMELDAYRRTVHVQVLDERMLVETSRLEALP